MRHDFLLALKSNVNARTDGGDLIVFSRGGEALRLHNPASALRGLVEDLAKGRETGDDLCEKAARENAPADLTRLYFVLETLGARGFIRYTLAPGGARLASLEPVSSAFRFEEFSTAEPKSKVSLRTGFHCAATYTTSDRGAYP